MPKTDDFGADGRLDVGYYRAFAHGTGSARNEA